MSLNENERNIGQEYPLPNISEQNLPQKVNIQQEKKDFTQQEEEELNQWKSSNKLFGGTIYLVSGLYLLIAGIIFAIKNEEVIEYKVNYGILDKCLNPSETSICEFILQIEQTMKQPIFVYYEMKNFNQNHQIYLESYDYSQLYSNSNDSLNSNRCKPFRTNMDLNEKFQKQINQNNPSKEIILKNLNGKIFQNSQLNDVAFPCGLRAFTIFNDEYKIYNSEVQKQNEIFVNSTNISWNYDKKYMKNLNTQDYKDKQWLDLEDERVQNWMRPSGLSKFKKLWGRIEQNLQPGSYVVQVKNKYDSQFFDSQKSFIISTVNSIGGKNPVLVISHLIAGSVSFLIGIVLVIYHFKYKFYKQNQY
ncbi:ligand-effect modulator 3 LEM3 family protein, putative [Ichthyophthirius multifiliis]|uniref:Ligand-effect modulator 3 LEM3 family protein, putative n=1 Tax=Ichthyophthirius multifiliis TaxID=5932 RepID=G0QPD4_ICHMU|nr:ligand-effect modulator 3 LEM3 family protein, putative [Ichthyophthirius multifiliis]EGR32922.1 ligand-effect modulator 3 LEM3 family protein, putative [Ichthyophthirius multifiliis]|eukprot:XP_004036908.1 ligand-effect modulator 3 LEM3 family protein, putative [Ichthyophthirius multifiliis]